MRQETQHLHYRAAAPRPRRNRLWFGLGLLVVGAIVVGLRKLETMPHRPPHDMSTFLGRAELAFVRAMIVCFTAAWYVLLVGFVVSVRSVRSRRRAA